MYVPEEQSGLVAAAREPNRTGRTAPIQDDRFSLSGKAQAGATAGPAWNVVIAIASSAGPGRGSDRPRRPSCPRGAASGDLEPVRGERESSVARCRRTGRGFRPNLHRSSPRPESKGHPRLESLLAWRSARARLRSPAADPPDPGSGPACSRSLPRRPNTGGCGRTRPAPGACARSPRGWTCCRGDGREPHPRSP